MSRRILVVDDEPRIREVICVALERAGMSTAVARNGAEALDLATRAPADLMILDIGMPEMDGLEVCRQLRRTSSLPILFLSARDDEIDRVLGLEMGGDDYVTKPFSPRELVARVNVILRRSRPGTATAALRFGPLALDPDTHAATAEGEPLDLTATEFAILRVMLQRPQSVHTREQLMHAAYAPNIFVADRTIDSHIRNLRAKLAQAGAAKAIATVHGVGFRLLDTKTGNTR